jgi:D-alanine-D-alanine ligase-like ATP-grasp enzyme
VLEINPNPCITPGVGFVKAAESCGLNYTEMIKLLITAL